MYAFIRIMFLYKLIKTLAIYNIKLRYWYIYIAKGCVAGGLRFDCRS